MSIPAAAFADMQYGDFLKSAAALVECLQEGIASCRWVNWYWRACGQLGRALESIRTSGRCCCLLHWLKAWSPQIVAEELHAATKVVLGNLTPRDSEDIYEAIRVAKPGGLGEASQHDVNAEPPADLLVAMRYASATDAVAAQYANGFDDLFQRLVPWFDQSIVNGKDAFSCGT